MHQPRKALPALGTEPRATGQKFCATALKLPRQVAGAVQHALDVHCVLAGQVAIQHQVATVHRHAQPRSEVGAEGIEVR